MLRMNDNRFCENNTYIVSIIEAVDRLNADSYMWVMNLNNGVVWCPENTQEFFGLNSQLDSNFIGTMSELVYPYDRNEFMDGIQARMSQPMNAQDLCVRINCADNKYCLFSIHTECITDESGLPVFMVIVFKNENFFPDYDPLTFLFTYSKFSKDLPMVISEYHNVAVLKIGIEAFNNFHIIYGVDYANEILRQTAIDFIYMMDEHSAVYRLDGECFAFIIKDCDRNGLIEFEQRIRKKLSDGIMVHDNKVILKISAGAVLLEGYSGDVSAIHSKVSYAFNHSLQAHQGRLIIFNDEVRISDNVDLELMKIIHQSVRNDCTGFYLLYQPIVDSSTGDIMGVEALIRWSMEPYGNVSPRMFIEWMETDPSMYELGNFVMHKALTETLPLLSLKPDFFVNVNISARQLERPEFIQAIQTILEETGFPASNLCMELTERCKDFPLDSLRKLVEYFQSKGIRFAMDDYGTGSASSSIVMNVPMNEIKIDMSFIRGIIHNPKNQAMVRSIVDFANRSGINTCIEGVENAELESFLRSYNATWFQGYHYARPSSIEHIEDMLKSDHMQSDSGSI